MGSSPDVPCLFTVSRNVQGGHHRCSCVVHFVSVCEGVIIGCALNGMGVIRACDWHVFVRG